jgi:hypothetical protein
MIISSTLQGEYANQFHFTFFIMRLANLRQKN